MMNLDRKHMKCRHILPVLFLTPSAWAVSPLLTDDADTVPAGEFELVLTSGFAREPGARLNPFLIALTRGVTPQVEIAIEGGYLFGETGGSRDDGWADTELSVKWKFSAAEDPAFLAALFAGVKLPTASQSKGFGSGDPDCSLGIIGTWALAEGTFLDANLGYTATDTLKPSTVTDSLFLGLAVRHDLSETFTLVAEGVTEMRPDRFSGAETRLRAGFQWQVAEARFVDFAFGHGLGSISGNREATLGLRLEF